MSLFFASIVFPDEVPVLISTEGGRSSSSSSLDDVRPEMLAVLALASSTSNIGAVEPLVNLNKTLNESIVWHLRVPSVYRSTMPTGSRVAECGQRVPFLSSRSTSNMCDVYCNTSSSPWDTWVGLCDLMVGGVCGLLQGALRGCADAASAHAAMWCCYATGCASALVLLLRFYQSFVRPLLNEHVGVWEPRRLSLFYGAYLNQKKIL